jgi:hypothetical protein
MRVESPFFPQRKVIQGLWIIFQPQKQKEVTIIP